MKKLVIINIILIVILYLIPTVKIVEIINTMELSFDFTIEKENINENISSRSGDIRNSSELHTSEQAIELLKKCEGFDEVAKKYKGEKYYTIGHGHYGKDVQKGQSITREDAHILLKNDLASNYEVSVKKYCDYLNLSQNEFDALVIFTYNLGEGNLKKLTDNKKRDKAQMMEHILNYTNSGNSNNKKGLLKRRNIEKRIFEMGVYSYEN